MPGYYSEVTGKRIDPPCPFVEVDVLNHVSLDTRTSLAKVDTGADQTCVPVTLLATLGVQYHDKQVRRDFNGRPVECPLYFINLRLLGRQFERLEVVGACRHDWVLLGRDILNVLLLSLDGPRQRFRLSRPAFWRRALRCW